MPLPQVVTAVCDSSVSIHRMAFNQPAPSSLLYKSVNFTTQHGTATANWQKKRLTHASGWMALLVGGETHAIEFADSNQVIVQRCRDVQHVELVLAAWRDVHHELKYLRHG